jgi:AraC-like DNA-binding protein
MLASMGGPRTTGAEWSRPGYIEWAPPGVLRHAVSCLWASVTGSADRRSLIVPDTCSDLLWQQGQGALVAGPDTGPVSATQPAGTVVFGVRFWPWAGGAILGLPLSELRDQRVSLAEIPRAGTLSAALDPDQAAQAIVDLAGRLVADSELDTVITHAARLLRDPDVRVERVADQTGISMRQLRRRCDAAAGYGPKTLQRILRFQRFVRRIDAGETDLAAIAADVGYADQAHLTRECGQLTGLTPTALAKARAGAL